MSTFLSGNSINILALDTSSKAASCAILCGGELRGEFFLNAGLTHSQTIMPMVERLLAIAGLCPQQIDRFALAVGPGSFTGLRIGLSAVKGMAMEPEKPCAGISTLEALAYNLRGCTGYILPVMDARRMQVYTARFLASGGQIVRETPDEALSVEELGGCIAALPGNAPILLVGDGARLCMESLGQRFPRLLVAPPTLLHQRAASVALVAAELPESRWISPAELAPVYLRLPQAERELLAKKTGDSSG